MTHRTRTPRGGVLIDLRILLLAALVALPTGEPPAQQTSERLNAVFAEYDEEFLELNPISATFRGDHRYDDRFVNSLTDEYATQMRSLQERYLDRLGEFDPEDLGPQDRLSYDIFKLQRENTLEGFTEGYFDLRNLMPVDQFFGFHNFLALLGAGGNAQPFKTVEDYDNWLKRSAGYTEWTDSAIAKMRQGIEAGVVQPRLIMEKVIPQLEAHLLDDVEESVFWRPITNMPEDIPAADRERLTAAYREHIANVLVPAYRKMRDFVRDEYMPHTRETVGLSHIPGGAELYGYNVRTITTTDLTPEQIHEIGKREAEMLFAEMERVRDEVGFDGDMQAFFEYLRTDPELFFDNEQELLAGYEKLRGEINGALDRIFDIMPEADYVIKPVESYRAPQMAAAQYFRAAPDGSRPGIFYVNTYKLDARPKYGMVALSLHEASPGHHFQISIAQEIEELPAFRRFGGFTAYVEGWALYAESLGSELGLYTDPYQYFGALYFDIWRANRLVVDTGMHALAWTRQQAIDWMMSNSPMAEQDVVAEVDRYIVIPGQALAYKIGQLKIRELRTRAETELGDDFDVREFHNVVLTAGAVPLSALESRVDRWIESKSP
jgi:uncharacterized protein (DUF885 family)